MATRGKFERKYERFAFRYGGIELKAEHQLKMTIKYTLETKLLFFLVAEINFKINRNLRKSPERWNSDLEIRYHDIVFLNDEWITP